MFSKADHEKPGPALPRFGTVGLKFVDDLANLFGVGAGEADAYMIVFAFAVPAAFVVQSPRRVTPSRSAYFSLAVALLE